MATLNTPQQLRSLAKQYEDAAQKLRDAADVLDGGVITPSPPKEPEVRFGQASRGTRLEELKQYLRDHGPCTRQEIKENSGIPKGTIGAHLKEDNGFAKDIHGRWYVPDANGEEGKEDD